VRQLGEGRQLSPLDYWSEGVSCQIFGLLVSGYWWGKNNNNNPFGLLVRVIYLPPIIQAPKGRGLLEGGKW